MLARLDSVFVPGVFSQALEFSIWSGENMNIVTDLLNSPAVEFCGYTIPHPSDPKMNVRIQTNGMFLLLLLLSCLLAECCI